MILKHSPNLHDMAVVNIYTFSSGCFPPAY